MEPKSVSLAELTPDFIDGLSPREQRYDVLLESDFVFSVLPNGIKTWAFIYSYSGRQRRKTLGVYPEMDPDQAFRALNSARMMVRQLDEPLEEVIGEAPPTHPWGNSTPVGRSLPKWLLSAVALTAVGAAVLLWARGENAPAALAPVAESPQAGAPAGDETESPGNGATPSMNETAARQMAVNVPATDPDAPVTGPIETAKVAAVTPLPLPATTTMPRAAGEPPVNSEATADSEATGDSEPPAADQPPAAETRAAAADSLPREDSPAPAAGKSAPGGAGAPKIGVVARAVLTSAVVSREPVDDLGGSVVAADTGQGRLHFFTELREFEPQTVTHRWLLNGEVVSVVSLEVRGTWRWRTYSSKDYYPDDMGDWRVEVLGENGEVVASHEFVLAR